MYVAALVFVCIEQASAQPYEFVFTSAPDLGTQVHLLRMDLMTGSKDTVFRNAGRFERLLYNPGQNWVFLNVRGTGEYQVISPEIPDSVFKVFDMHRGVIRGILDGPNQTMYVSAGFTAGDADTVGKAGSLLVDRNTLAVLDTIPSTDVNLKKDGHHNRLRSFFSADKSFLYTFVYGDKSGIFFDKTETRTMVKSEKRQCGGLSGFVYGPSLSDAKHGRAVVSFETAAGIENQKYVLCDVDAGSIKSMIPFGKRAKVYLSSDGNKVIIEEVVWDLSKSSGEYRTGRVHLHDFDTGQLLQHFVLPPEGEILLFEDYSEKMFYYLSSEGRCIVVNFGTLPMISGTNPSLVHAGTGDFALRVLGTGFSEGQVVHWNRQPRATSFESDTLLIATISSADLTSPGVASVTVVNAGRDTSNSALVSIVSIPSTGVAVRLVNSFGTRLTDGSLQYYEGNWKDATNNNDGTFGVNTTLATVSLRMTYEGGSQQKNNVPVGPDTVVWQTVNTQVKLQNSQGALIDTGAVQYYAGSWRTLGTTSNGVATKELLPVSYSFRMTYAYGSNDKQQDVGANPVVVFQTTNARVQLQNSLGAFIDQGSVQYYGGAWRNFGITTNGSVSKELLPNNYSFRMTYAYGSNDKSQNIGANPIVVFNTVNATVELRNSQGALVDGGSVQYYAGAWRSFGSTSGGTVSKELLPANYSFRMTREYIPVDKSQNISTNNTVGFSTVLCTIRVRNAQNQPVNGAVASYYSTAWRQIGSTSNGEITKELLPANLTFRIVSGGITQDKVQNLGANTLVEFTTQ